MIKNIIHRAYGDEEFYQMEAGDRVRTWGMNEFGGLHGMENGMEGTLLNIDKSGGWDWVYTVQWDNGDTDTFNSYFFDQYVRLDKQASKVSKTVEESR